MGLRASRFDPERHRMRAGHRGLASVSSPSHTRSMPPIAIQVLSLTGAGLILIAFVASTSGRMVHGGARYAALNAIGSIAMGISMIQPLNLGGLILQVVWTLYSAWLLLRAWRRRV